VFSDDEEVDLDKEVLRRERMGAVVSSGKDYARRPVGYKQSLSHTNAPTKFAGHQEPRRGNYARRKKDVQREASPSPETNRSAAASNPQARARLLKLRVLFLSFFCIHRSLQFISKNRTMLRTNSNFAVVLF